MVCALFYNAHNWWTVSDRDFSFYFNQKPITGSATERLVETSAVCQPGLELKVHVKTVNQAENGELLGSPWSVEGVYQCKPEGISDTRFHITIEVVHVHRFEMVPPSFALRHQALWQAPFETRPHSSQNLQSYDHFPQSWNRYYPWYLPVTQPVRPPVRTLPSVMASFSRKKNSRINHPWWWNYSSPSTMLKTVICSAESHLPGWFTLVLVLPRVLLP